MSKNNEYSNRRGFIAAIKKYYKANYGILGALVVLCVLISIFAPNFFQLNNFVNILRQISVNGIVAIGMTVVLLGGGIDLSVGSVCAAAGCLFAVLFNAGLDPILTVVATLAVACGIGLANGALVSLTKIPAFIVTISTQMIVRGIAYWFTGGYPVVNNTEVFGVIGAGSWVIKDSANQVVFELPYSIIVMIMMYLITWAILMRSRYGRHVYAVGGNIVAASHSGIKIRKVLTGTYVISAVMAGIAGIILASRVYSGQPTAGTGYETTAIAASVVGGISFTGGFGFIGGTFIGSLIMGIIRNGMNMLKLDYYFQYIAEGSIVIIAVLIDAYVKKDRKIKK